MTRVDVYKKVTNRLIEALKQNDIPWRKPWRTLSDDPMQRNWESKRAYRGINQFLLQLAPFEWPYWITFKGAQRLGGTVRKGEHGTFVVWFKQWRVDDINEDGDREEKIIPLLRYYTVFNIEQCDGLEMPEPTKVTYPQPERIAVCDDIVSQYPDPPSIRVEGGSASYAPKTDEVKVPALSRFKNASAHYHVLFHELVHSTGHESRLDRELNTNMRSSSYSREELIAEFGAAMLCGIAGMEPDLPNSAAYIGHWISKLEDDPKLPIHAAARAQRAVDHILRQTPDDAASIEKPAETAATT